MSQNPATASITDAARILNVSTKTLRRWEAKGVLIPIRTDGGHRRYDLMKIRELKGNKRKVRLIQSPAPEATPVPIEVRDIPVLYTRLHADQQKILRIVLSTVILTTLSFGVIKASQSEFLNSIKVGLLGTNINNPQLKASESEQAVLAAETSSLTPKFNINIESAFKDNSLFTKNVEIDGDLTLKGQIIGDVDTTGVVIVGGNSITSGQTTFNLLNTGTNTLNLGGAATAITIGSTAGTTTVRNNLNVGGASAIAGALTVGGTETVTGKITGNGDLAISGNATFGNITSVNGVTYSFPSSQGGSGTVLKNDGSGTLTWASQLASSLSDLSGVLGIDHGGTNNSTPYTSGSVIFSNGTKLSEDNSYFYYDSTNHRLGLGTTSPTTALDVSGTITATSIFQGSFQVCDASGANCPSAGSGGSKWQINSGAISPFSSSLDVLIGGTATSSAKFAFKNVSAGTPTASISGTAANVATFIDGDGNISTTNRNNLVLGNSSTYDSTGNTLINPNGTGSVGIGNGSPLATLDVTGTGLFSSTLTASNGFTLSTGALNLTSTSGTSNLTSTAGSGSAFSFTDSLLTADASNLALMTFQNANTGAGTSVNGLRIVASGSTPSSGTNTENLISLSGTTLGSNTFNGIYFNTGLSNYVNSTNWTVTAAGAQTIASDLGVNGGNITTTQSIANIFTGATTLGIGNAAGTTTINGALAVSGLSNLNGNSVIGDAITDTISFTGRVAQDSDLIPVGTTGTNDLGTSLLPWDNIYGVSLFQGGNAVCDASGANCPNGVSYWDQASGALYALNNSVDLLLGSSATSSAKFAFTGVSGGIPTASISGTTANVSTFLTGNGNLATTNNANLTLGGNTTGNIILNPNNSLAGGFIAPNTNNVTDLGTASLIFRNIYGGTIAGTTLTQGGNNVCDSSGANCPAAGSGGSKWRLLSGAIAPFTDTLDVLIGSTSTTSAKFAFKNVSSGTPTASISGTTANVSTYLTGEGNLATTNNANITIGGAFSGNIILNPNNTAAGGYIAPNTNAVTDLGTNTTAFRNIYGTTLYQSGNQVCDTSGNCSGISSSWQLNNKIISPANSTYDLAIGGTATGSAFQVFGIEKAADTTSRIAKINSTAITTGSLFEATSSAITSGNIIKLGTGGDNAAFAGNGIYMDFDNSGGGNFTGNFLKFDNSLTTRFTVDSNGNIGIAGGSGIDTLTAGALSLGTTNANAVSISKSGVTTTVNGSLTSSQTLTASNGFTLTTGVLNLTSTSGTSNLNSTATGGDSFAFTNTSLNTDSANLANFTVKNNNSSGAGLAVNGINVSGTGSSPLSGTNTTNLLNISATALANNTFNGINFGNGLTNYINGTNFTVTSAGNVSAQGGLTVTGGTVNLNFSGTSSTNIGNTTGTTTIAGNILPASTNSSNLGSSSSLQFNSIYANSFIQNGNNVCDASGANCPSASSGGSKWKLSSGAISPFSDSLDVLIGSSATASAKFAFRNVATGTPTASISGTTANVATFIDGNGNISSTNRNNLTLGNSSTYNSTGNILLNPNGTGNVGIGTTSPAAKLEVSGDLYFTNTASSKTIKTANGQTLSASDALTVTTGDSAAGGATAGSLYLTAGASMTDEFFQNYSGPNVYIYGGSKSGGGALDGNVIIAHTGSSTKGLVGIGTTSPGALLDVAGTASVSGTLTIGNGSAIQPAYGPLTLNYKSGANAWATGLLLRDTSGDVEIAGGSGSTGCTVTNSNGNLTCTGTISASGIAASTVPFSGITSGTNTVAAMIVDTGASLNFSNSGTINASSLLGATWAAPGTIGSGTPNSGGFTTLTSSGNSTLGTGASSVNTFGAGASSVNTIGSVTTPGALTLHGATTLDNSFTISGNNIASISGVLTVGNGTTNTIQSPFGPLNLAYKSGADTWATGLSLTDTTGDVVVSQDLAVNGGDLTTSQTTASLFNTTATTLSLGGAATTALNIGNGTGNYTAINLGSGAGTHTINIAGTGATAADIINIDTGGTGADTINIGSSASSTALNLTSGTGSQTFASSVVSGTSASSSFVFTGNALTTGTGMYLNSSSITTGTLLALNATGTTLTTGKLLDIQNNSSSVFSVGSSQITSALPHQFTAAGDVAISNDLVFTNQTASTIDSYGPLTIRSGESFESNNLTFKTYNSGNVIFDQAVNGKVLIGTGSATLKFTVSDSQAATAAAMIENTYNGSDADGLAVKLGYTGNGSTTNRFVTFLNGVGTTVGRIEATTGLGVAYQTSGIDFAEYFTKDLGTSFEEGDIVSLKSSSATKANGENDPGMIGVVSNSPGFKGGNEGPDKVLVGLVGQVPLKISQGSDPIKVGDLITSSSDSGRGKKSNGPGFIIGKALEPWTGQDKIMVYLSPSWADPTMNLTSNGNLKIATDDQNPGYSKITDSNGNVLQKLSGLTGLITNSFSAFQGTIDNLLIKTGLISPQILTKNIKPLEGEKDINITVGNNTETGKLAVLNSEGTEVASVDSTGDATFSGNLSAGTIYADQIIARNASFENINTASISGVTKEYIESLLAGIEEDKNLLNQAQNWNTNTATSSSALTNLDLQNLYVTGVAAINSLLINSSLTVGSDLTITKISTDALSLTTLDTIDSPLSIQSSANQPLYIMAGKVKVDTSGNVEILGNLAVGGVLSTSAVSIAEDPNAKSEGEVLTSLASAGQATIASGSAELKLQNPNIKTGSLIFVTPTSPTIESLFIKSEATGSAVIGFNNPAGNDVKFNWWIVGKAE